MRAKVIGCVVGTVSALALSGCGFNPYNLPLPGGADVGSNPYKVNVEFRDVLDLVPQSAVRVNEIAVGKVIDIKLNGWTAVVTLKINKNTELPDNAEATIRQTSLLGEKFVSLAPPTTGATGQLGNGDLIPLARSGRNPELEEVFGATSLLFNGGGLEKTNTIMKELNKALDGNEPEVKEFIASSTDFLGQLDDNKARLLTSLEKIDHLAVETNKQKAAITGALDDLPAALRVVDEQRDDLVKLLESLDKLSGVATRVVKESKADTVADFKALQPVLTQLAKVGDEFAYDFKILFTYPFNDGIVGNDISQASGRCSNTNSEQNTGSCFGDFTNLSVRMDIDQAALKNILGDFDLSGVGGSDTGTGTPALPTQDLVDLVEGLVPSTNLPPASGLPGGLPALPGASSSSQQTTDDTTDNSPAGLQLPGFCSLLAQCRTTVTSAVTGELGQLLMEPVVTP